MQQLSTNEYSPRYAVMVRFGELFLKSEPVRRRFLNVLMRNIDLALTTESVDHKIELYRGRILIHSPTPGAAIPVLSRIFGIVDVSLTLVTIPTKEELSRAAMFFAHNNLNPGMSFAIRARREGIPDYTSQELAAFIGSDILTLVPDATVDLTNPDYEIHVEARKEGGLVYDTRVSGPGGLPLGTQGTIISLLSAGIDSPVSSWLMMKRGVTPTFLHMDGGSYGGDANWGCTKSNLCQLSRWSPGVPLTMYVIQGKPFFDAVTRIQKTRYRCIICKVFMLMLAEALANECGAEGIITGDNLGQVATQTLTNLSLLSSVTGVPIFRPLIAYDKEEIIQHAKIIGTFIAEPGNTSCYVVPKHPATHGEKKEVEACIQEMDIPRLIQEGIAQKSRIIAKDGIITEC